MRFLAVSSGLLLAVVLLSSSAQGSGVCYKDPAIGEFMPLVTSEVQISVQNQVAVFTATQEFRNTDDEPYWFSYGFPLPERASATSLSWRIGGEWAEADIAAEEPDSLPGEGETDPDLEAYLGQTPLLFTCSDCDSVPPDSVFAVQLTYVMLLPYAFGGVTATYPNDYQLIQTDAVNEQRFHLTLSSLREIESIELTSHIASSTTNDGSSAEIFYEAYEQPADTDYRAVYSLSLDELGLFGMSSWFDDEDVPDDIGRGFFTFIAEPEPDTTVVLDKVFTLIVDRSGSMTGSKIEQARDGATFIVDNLNPGDRFNIVDFATYVSSLASAHLPYTPQSASEARDYIGDLEASSLTNISGAFSLAVPQFDAASDTTANIIIFFTDGMPTTGITETEALLAHVHQLIVSTETRINLFVLGIGEDVNTSLLSRMASENDGFAQFLRDDELEEIITGFYLQIRNPVLLDTEIAFTPPDVVSEVYPDPLPNLYQGVQMVVSGRYRTPADVEIELSGNAFGSPVSYAYDLTLVDSADVDLTFLTKLWAKSKIEHLLRAYYAESDPEVRDALREEIIALSVAYGVLSPFTSFNEPEDPGTPIDDSEIDPGDIAIGIEGPYKLLGNRPNPFNPRTTIAFVVSLDVQGPIFVRIYDVRGRFVQELVVMAAGPGVYEVVWDGTYADGTRAGTGVYLYSVDFGDAVLVGKMTLVN